MNTDLKEFFIDLSLNGFFINNPILGADAMLSNKDIKFHLLQPINRKEYIYIYNIHNDIDLILGEKYDVVFLREDPRNYEKTEAEIDFVSLKKGDNIGILPSGYGGIIRLKFKNKIPEMTKLLMQDGNEKFNKNKHKFITFTTQKIMDRILEELDKAEKLSRPEIG